MSTPDRLSTISAFARRVGLTPSALRFYDDCGLLTPRFVEPASGYRYYAEDQEERAIALRELRAAEMPLSDIRAILDGCPDDAARVAHVHVRALEDKLGPARQVAARLLAQVPSARRRCLVVLSGEELASAARQVVPAAATSDEHPVLTHVLLELGPDETTMVATDRYRLSVRALRSYDFSGLPRRLLVPAADLSELAGWAAWEHRVEIDADGERATLIRGGQRRAITTTADLDFPAYQSLVDGAGPPISRTIVDRVRLLNWVVEQTPHPIQLAVYADRVEMSRTDGTASARFDAIASGPPLRTGFTPAVLGAALAASVGPDVLLEFVDPILPVVVRSADQATFTTLAMPILLEPEDRSRNPHCGARHTSPR